MAEASQPIVTNDLNDIRAVSTAANLSVDLFAHFDDPSTTGLVARFELFASVLGSRVKEVLLFDQAGAGAPLTVQNFLNYVNDGDYVNTFIDRSIPGFVVQGGRFTIDNLANNLANPRNALGIIPTDPPVPNEFSSDRSNLRGTIAMAKPENDPNGATNQWFFNLGDNSANLDNQNGGSTVFGEVLSASDLAVIDAIAAVDIFNGTGLDPAFSNLPLSFSDPRNPVITGDENFVRYSSITVDQRDELTFSISNNTNPGLLNVSIIDEQLVLDYLPDQFGTADITIQATNLLGQVVEDTFSVTVDKNWRGAAAAIPSRAPRPLSASLAFRDPTGSPAGAVATSLSILVRSMAATRLPTSPWAKTRLS
ncbi:peptidylprolyl isomerase [Oscillatoria sp. CS-180]|uniref:peptidylprolyl isomerase n=1 Tax=Oscillatoria sp. CS-180 TaxID=3021720 RepID=UPI00232DB1FC|nr:peptidylprolyl isomerase [Oscillatoria sp. CS-180]MDB9524579.1 peptidylprolyl isomerase [Oscillatoria sp. CS-180]